ncbi:MAG: hypothetical protein JO053_05865 [Acidobacteria bacterium]|nr:hypothetical protein [Acidobacteriota bacterium]
MSIWKAFSVTLVLLLGVCVAISQTTKPKKVKFDAKLAQSLGADDYGMRNYIFCILKTGPNDGNYKGKERDNLFAGHFANIQRLAEIGKLALAGPFGKNDRNYRGLFIFSVSTIEEAEQLVQTDPTVKAGVLVPELTPWYGTAAVMRVGAVHKKIQKKQF